MVFMKKVLVKPNGIVVAVATTVEQVPNGLLVDNDVIYADPNLTVVETDEEVLPFKNTLIDGVVGINPQYLVSEEYIRQQAIDEYTLELLEGGII